MVNYTQARDGKMNGSETVAGPGYILKVGAGTNDLSVGTAGAVALGISAGESERAAGGALDTSAASVSFLPVGNVLMVQATASQTWAVGAQVYAGASGLATTSNASSAKKLGLYVGPGESVPAAGGMIPVNTMGAEQA
tara:strand:- start:1357 stop:1770 length:414 start_codon:yes stop_codon:yes gene_type:complete